MPSTRPSVSRSRANQRRSQDSEVILAKVVAWPAVAWNPDHDREVRSMAPPVRIFACLTALVLFASACSVDEAATPEPEPAPEPTAPSNAGAVAHSANRPARRAIHRHRSRLFPRLRTETGQHHRMLGQRLRRPRQPARWAVRRYCSRLSPQLRGENRQHHRMLGRRRIRPEQPSWRTVHRRRSGHLPHLRAETGRHHRMLGHFHPWWALRT